MKVYLMINIGISVLHSQSVQSFIYCSFSTFSKKNDLHTIRAECTSSVPNAKNKK